MVDDVSGEFAIMAAIVHFPSVGHKEEATQDINQTSVGVASVGAAPRNSTTQRSAVIVSAILVVDVIPGRTIVGVEAL